MQERTRKQSGQGGMRNRCVSCQMCAAGAMQMWADVGRWHVSEPREPPGYLRNLNMYRGHIEGKGGGYGDPRPMHTGERASRDDSHA